MKKLALVVLASSALLPAQQIKQKANEPPPQASFGLQDPSVIQRLPESKADAKLSGEIPRLADGKPDLSGPWQPNAIRENVNIVAAGVKVPFTDAGKKIYDSRIGVLGKDDPEARCLPPGVPRLTTTPYPFRFLQVPGLIVIIYEGGSQTFRQIFTDGRGFSKFAEDLWNGESIGRWAGDTLVVQTRGFNDRTWIDAAGVPHTTDMLVTEHIRLLDANNMEIVSTMHDPAMFTADWSFTTHPKKMNGEIMEYICNENEADVKHMVGK